MKEALVVGGLVTLAAVAIWIARNPGNNKPDRSKSRRRAERILYREGPGVIPEHQRSGKARRNMSAILTRPFIPCRAAVCRSLRWQSLEHKDGNPGLAWTSASFPATITGSAV